MSGDGGGGGGDGGGGAGDSVDVVSDTNPNATPGEVDEATEAAAGAAAAPATLSFSEAISEGFKSAAAKDPGMMALASVVPGMGILSASAALANAPHGSLAGDDSSDPDPGGEAGEVGGPPEPVETPRPAAPAPPSTPVATPPAEPVTKEPSTGAVAAPSAEPPAAPTATPNKATAAPGTLLRRRRRTQTILTSPQGVLGGAVSTRAGRRTRSLPRKTLLGG
jgi:cell division septation protein DedD|tara:strand:+ start:2202 stop:2867 length:666 start_codon:yes stop_codon:yes gene_type:complete